MQVLCTAGCLNTLWRREANSRLGVLCEEKWPGLMQRWPADVTSVRKLFKILYDCPLARYTAADLTELRAECEQRYPGVADDSVHFLHCMDLRHAALVELVVSKRLGWLHELAPSQRARLDPSNVLLLIAGSARESGGCDSPAPVCFRHVYQLSEHTLHGDGESERTPYIRLPVPELRDASVRERWLKSQSHTMECLLLNRRTQTAIRLSDGRDTGEPYGSLPHKCESILGEPERYDWLQVTFPEPESWPGGAAGKALRRAGYMQRAVDFCIDVADCEDAALCLSMECTDWEFGADLKWEDGSGSSMLADGAFAAGVLDSDSLLPWRFGYNTNGRCRLGPLDNPGYAPGLSLEIGIAPPGVAGSIQIPLGPSVPNTDTNGDPVPDGDAPHPGSSDHST